MFNDLFNYIIFNGLIVYLDVGVYIVLDIIFIFLGVKIVGEVLVVVIMGIGVNF